MSMRCISIAVHRNASSVVVDGFAYGFSQRVHVTAAVRSVGRGAGSHGGTGAGHGSDNIISNTRAAHRCRGTSSVYARTGDGGGAGRVLRADRGQAGARRADTRVQADHAPRVRGHRGGRPARPVVRPRPAAGVRGRDGRGRGLSRPRGPRQRVRVPAGQAPRHAARDGPLRYGRGRRPRARGRPVDGHIHVIQHDPYSIIVITILCCCVKYVIVTQYRPTNIGHIISCQLWYRAIIFSCVQQKTHGEMCVTRPYL